MEINSASNRAVSAAQPAMTEGNLTTEDAPKQSLSTIMSKYDITNITPKQIDSLVAELRENNLAPFEQVMMLATWGHEFQSHLPGIGQSNKAFNLIAQSEYQLELSRRHGSPTEFMEKQLEFIKSLQPGKSSRHAVAASSSTAIDGDKWLQQMLQGVLDGRIGLDRSKLEEIEAKIEKIKNDPNIKDDQKALLIEALEQQKIELVRKTAEQMIEKEKQLQRLRVGDSDKNQQIVDALNKTIMLSNSKQHNKSVIKAI